MLKYEGVVNRLSEGEKINILTDLSGLSDRELINMGIPAVRAGELASMTENIFPSPAALAGSWNCELVRRVGEASAIYMASKGVGIAITPAAKIKIDPYGTALSEDVRLAASLANSYAVGAKRGGLRPCISELGISASETAWLDRSPDERIIYEYVARPYIEALSERHVGVYIKEETLAGEYGERSQELIKMAAGGKLGEAVAVLCRNANAENTVRYINQGIICLKGSGYALQAALNKYTKIKKAIDRGEMGDEELLGDIECGNLIFDGRALDNHFLMELNAELKAMKKKVCKEG